MTKVLEARNIVKQFPGVLANDRVNFDLEQGEIHAMLGENGAGNVLPEFCGWFYWGIFTHVVASDHGCKGSKTSMS